MFTVCWSIKGGSGTSVIAAALALRGSGLLVDLCGDAAAILGVPEPQGPGVTDWLAAHDDVGAAALSRLIIDHQVVSCIHRGNGEVRAERWLALAAALNEPLNAAGRVADGPIIVDAGCHPPTALLESAGSSLLVVRACYLALRSAATVGHRATGVVMIEEAGRPLGQRDVERAVGAPVIARVPFDSKISRAVDSGLLSGRTPRVLSHRLRAAA